MAKIFRFEDFVGKKGPAENKKRIIQKEEKADKGKGEKGKISISMEELKSFYSAGGYAKIKKIKDSMEGFISQVTIQENREIVKDYSSEALINWINNSGYLEWSEKPAFFRAVIDEILHRIKNRE